MHLMLDKIAKICYLLALSLTIESFVDTVRNVFRITALILWRKNHEEIVQEVFGDVPAANDTLHR